MIRLRLIVLIFSFPLLSIGQQSQHFGVLPVTVVDTFSLCQPDGLFHVIDAMPEYDGGFERLEEDLNSCLDIREAGKGDIYLQVVVNCKGEAGEFKVLRTAFPEWNSRIESCMSELQSWVKGCHQEKPVDCLMYVQLRYAKEHFRVVR